MRPQFECKALLRRWATPKQSFRNRNAFFGYVHARRSTMITTAHLITDIDRRRLGSMLQRAQRSGVELRDYLHALESGLEQANSIEAAEVPDDVVTMNSTVELCDAASGEEETYTLVYPQHASAAEGRLSVLAPLGTAILGARVGDEVEVVTPSGGRRVRIERIHFQPESAGQFDL
jgi:regulator of nucleoside diphosphate kinase